MGLSLRFGTGLVVSAALACVPALPAAAQGMRQVRELPEDCRSVLPPGVAGTVQNWQAFVALEHCDRIKRLQRLSAALPPEKQPRFYEGIVPAHRLPAEFGVDVPVLRVVFPDRVFFDTGRSELRPEADAISAIVAASLRNEPPDVAMFVAGHADQRGGRPYNEALSVDRANRIAEAIFRRGVAFSSIWRIGFGEDMPLMSGTSLPELDRNRRIEFLFAARPEAVGQWLADQQLDELCSGATRAETDRCKAALEFQQGYDAVEVGRTAAVSVQEPPKAVTRADPKRPGPRQADAKTGTRRGRADPEGTTRRGVKLGQSALIGTTPTGSRKIRIVPRNPKTAAVRVDL